jgi:hypothetical protein
VLERQGQAEERDGVAADDAEAGPQLAEPVGGAEGAGAGDLEDDRGGEQE